MTTDPDALDPPPLPVMYMRDPFAWAAAEGIHFAGDVGAHPAGRQSANLPAKVSEADSDLRPAAHFEK